MKGTGCLNMNIHEQMFPPPLKFFYHGLMKRRHSWKIWKSNIMTRNSTTNVCLKYEWRALVGNDELNK